MNERYNLDYFAMFRRLFFFCLIVGISLVKMVLKLRGRSEKKFSINCKLNAIFVCYTHKYKMIRFSVKSNLRCQLNEW